MEDLSELLDAAQSTTCEFLGATINLEVYTAGSSRLTHEESKTWQEITQQYAPAQKQAVELEKKIKACEALLKAEPENETEKARLAELTSEWNELDTGAIEQARVALPFMLKGWSLNGAPMKRDGKDFPPTAENLKSVPDGMLLAVGEAAMAVWKNPTTAGSGSGSAPQEDQTDNSDSNQTETTLP